MGQYYLTDDSIAEKIVNLAELAPGDHVIEVGPGACALTGRLCERAGAVTAVEIDRRLAGAICTAMSRYPNFHFICADILKVSARSLVPAGASPRRVVLVSNMPYYISTPIMTRLFEELAFVDKAVLMMQKEVARKLTAQPSTADYCMLSVFAQSFYVPKKCFSVSPHCFVPQPGVESAVVALEPRSRPLFAGDAGEASEAAEAVEAVEALRQMFFRVVRAAFARRRKTLANSLVFAGLALGRAEAEGALALAGIPTGARGESLSHEAFAALAHALVGTSSATAVAEHHPNNEI